MTGNSAPFRGFTCKVLDARAIGTAVRVSDDASARRLLRLNEGDTVATYKRWHGRKITADHPQWKRARWIVEFVLNLGHSRPGVTPWCLNLNLLCVTSASSVSLWLLIPQQTITTETPLP